MDENVRKNWESFLNPDILRKNLITASIYLTAYEVLRDSIVNRIKDFYTDHYHPNKDEVDPKYISEVTSKNKDKTYASLSWLRQREAIDETDIDKFDKIKARRNKIAHELNQIIYKGLGDDLHNLFMDMISLLNKIEKWWIVNVEIPINQDISGREIDEDAIIPGPVISLQIMLNVAFGSEEESRSYLTEFIRLSGGT
ncbi:MAG: hypothetical protein ACYCX4_18455 [Bacillota bacterium]